MGGWQASAAEWLAGVADIGDDCSVVTAFLQAAIVSTARITVVRFNRFIKKVLMPSLTHSGVAPYSVNGFSGASLYALQSIIITIWYN
jgi:hypothetical protein